MTPTNKAWIDKRTRWCSIDATFVEVGSRDINGAPARRTKHYIGVDRIAGPAVDLVACAHALPFPAAMFDYGICADTLEHDQAPWETTKELQRVLRPRGLLIVTVPGIGFPRHDYPSDYWRFTTDGLGLLFKDFESMECVNDSSERAVRMFAKKC